jgi:hypothetical protein
VRVRSFTATDYRFVQGASHYPGTNYVAVTRTVQAAWTIEVNASTGAMAELIASTTSGRSVTYSEGFYQMPFSVSLTQP